MSRRNRAMSRSQSESPSKSRSSVDRGKERSPRNDRLGMRMRDARVKPSRAPSPSSSPVPDRIEPIVAWRVWRRKDDGLFSAYTWHEFVHPWRGVMVSPFGLGFHAFKRLQDALWMHWSAIYGPPAIVGQVVLWGSIVEYERGYTASHAMRRDEWEQTENFT